jgi:hypothetical protein
VTVYVYRHHRGECDGASLTDYNNQHVPRMLEGVREAAHALGWVDTVESDHTEYQFFSTREHLDDYALTPYLTRADPLTANSTLGLGHTASSFLGNFMRAQCRDSSDEFDSARPTWTLDLVPAAQRQRLFAIESLNRHGFIDLDAFATLFGLDLGDAFAEEMQALEREGKAILKDNRFCICARDRLEFAVLCKFFWDQPFLREESLA